MNAANAPFLLLRGLTREQRHWGAFIPALQQQLPETAIHTLDIPGNGVLYLSASPTSVADMTESLRQQIHATGLSGPFNLIALSMGGMIAIDWMTRYPEEICTGVVINSSISSFSPFYQRLRWQNYCSILKLCGQSAAHRERSILALTSNHKANNAALLSTWQQWQQQYPVKLKNALRQLIASARFKPRQKPVQPLLVVTAQADRLVDYRCSLKLQQAWQTALAVHPTAGHDLPLDDPDWLSRAIKNWLSDLAN